MVKKLPKRIEKKASQIEEILGKAKQLNLFLRTKYLQSLGDKPRVYSQPQGGEPENSIGPWPEFIFHSLACCNNKEGFCTPCGYSNIPPVSENGCQAYETLITQTHNIVDDPNEKILSKQRRKGPYPNFPKRFKDGMNAMMALTPIGSFFNKIELPLAYRIEVLQLVANMVNKHRINLQLFIEVHADDIIEADQEGELEQIVPLLRKLNTVVLVGLESIHELVREVLFFKNLTLPNFEKAIEILQERELQVGAFVFAGIHSMTEAETLEDVKETLVYLSDRDIVPVVMVANLQEYTLNHLLYVYDKYRILDPWSILELMRLLPTYSAKVETSDPWLFADPEGGPPSPVATPFQNSKKIACESCSKKILSIIRRLREDYDWERFDSVEMSIKNCTCRSEYREHVKKQGKTEGKIDLLDRALQNIRFADSVKKDYINSLLKN